MYKSSTLAFEFVPLLVWCMKIICFSLYCVNKGCVWDLFSKPLNRNCKLENIEKLLFNLGKSVRLSEPTFNRIRISTLDAHFSIFIVYNQNWNSARFSIRLDNEPIIFSCLYLKRQEGDRIHHHTRKTFISRCKVMITFRDNCIMLRKVEFILLFGACFRIKVYE